MTMNTPINPLSDPNVDVALALSALNAILTLIGNIRAQRGLTGEQIGAIADSGDLKNRDAIKALLAQ
jgi:hypothetical protein